MVTTQSSTSPFLSVQASPEDHSPTQSPFGANMTSSELLKSIQDTYLVAAVNIISK